MLKLKRIVIKAFLLFKDVVIRYAESDFYRSIDIAVKVNMHADKYR
jgi:hypothetical protein